MPSFPYRPFLSLVLSVALISESALGTPAGSSFSGPTLPRSLGSISETFTPPGKTGQPDFILIQNLHSNRSVQFAISRILKSLKKQALLPERIAAEGLVGPYDVTAMQRVPSRGKRKIAADYLLSQGEMPGEMHFVTTEGRGGLYGIESQELYDATIEMYRRSYPDRMRLSQQVDRLEVALERLPEPEIASNVKIVKNDLQTVKEFLQMQVVPDELNGRARNAVAAIEHLKACLLPSESAQLLDAISASVNFYALALLRDEAMFDRLLRLRQNDGQKTTVLVVGGFHTPGLTRRFKQRGSSYVVITPVIKRHDRVDERLYVDRMLGRHLTEEQVSEGRNWVLQDLAQPPLAANAPQLFLTRARAPWRTALAMGLFLSLPPILHSQAVEDPYKNAAPMSAAEQALTPPLQSPYVQKVLDRFERQYVSTLSDRVKYRAKLKVLESAPDAPQALIRVASNTEYDMDDIALVMEALGAYRDPEATQFLIGSLTYFDLNVSAAAARALGRIHDPATAPKIVALFKARGGAAAVPAVRLALVYLGEPSLGPIFAQVDEYERELLEYPSDFRKQDLHKRVEELLSAAEKINPQAVREWESTSRHQFYLTESRSQDLRATLKRWFLIGIMPFIFTVLVVWNFVSPTRRFKRRWQVDFGDTERELKAVFGMGLVTEIAAKATELGISPRQIFNVGFSPIIDRIESEGFVHQRVLIAELEKILQELRQPQEIAASVGGTSGHDDIVWDPDGVTRAGLTSAIQFLKAVDLSHVRPVNPVTPDHRDLIGHNGIGTLELAGTLGALFAAVAGLGPLVATVLTGAWVGSALAALGVGAVFYGGPRFFRQFRARRAAAALEEKHIQSLAQRLRSRLPTLHLSFPPVRDIFDKHLSWAKPSVSKAMTAERARILASA